jgi:hypothetical protein
LRLRPPRSRRNSFGHAVDDDQVTGRGGRRCDGVSQRTDDVACDAEGQQRKVEQHGFNLRVRLFTITYDRSSVTAVARNLSDRML